MLGEHPGRRLLAAGTALAGRTAGGGRADIRRELAEQQRQANRNRLLNPLSALRVAAEAEENIFESDSS